MSSLSCTLWGFQAHWLMSMVSFVLVPRKLSSVEFERLVMSGMTPVVAGVPALPLAMSDQSWLPLIKLISVNPLGQVVPEGVAIAGPPLELICSQQILLSTVAFPS